MKIITTYFNPLKVTSRLKLANEFVERYPFIHLIQNGNSINCNNTTIYNVPTFGFIDMILVNKWLESNEISDWLVMCDGDLIFPNNYFQKLNDLLGSLDHNDSIVAQPWDELYEKIDNYAVKCEVTSFSNGGVHSGHILCYSKGFLEKISYKFPEWFLVGGFDFYLMECLKQIVNDKFSEKIRGTKLMGMKSKIIHNYHGDKRYRTNQLGFYKKGLLTKEKILEYFKKKDSDVFFK